MATEVWINLVATIASQNRDLKPRIRPQSIANIAEHRNTGNWGTMKKCMDLVPHIFDNSTSKGFLLVEDMGGRNCSRYSFEVTHNSHLHESYVLLADSHNMLEYWGPSCGNTVQMIGCVKSAADFDLVDNWQELSAPLLTDFAGPFSELDSRIVARSIDLVACLRGLVDRRNIPVSCCESFRNFVDHQRGHDSFLD